MGEVRKLQKKLRQIENLEIKISLSPEERFKISRKAELRSRLAEIQLQLSGPQQTLGIVGDGKKEKMKRQVEDAPGALPSQTPPASKILKGEEEFKAQATPSPAARRTETVVEAAMGRKQEKTKPAKVSDQGQDVSGGCPDEEQQLQPEAWSLSLSDKERFILSGSADCYVKIWALSIDYEDDDDDNNNEVTDSRSGGAEDGGFGAWLRCVLHSISPVARLTALVYLLLIALVTPSTCNRDDTEGEEQVDALSVQLSVTAQVTPTPLWAVVWGPTQPLEDETYHFLSSQETDPRHHHGGQQEASTATSEDWPYPDASMQPREETPLESREPEGVEDGGTEAEETEEEDSRQTLHSTSSSFTDRESSAMVPNHSVLRPAMTNSQTSSLTAIAASHYPRKRPYLCFHNFQ
ncbi:hypothetical protein F2P81_002070 [Scophthalmus maximus]|uniref:Uncharacterized protein n=1 Tax=Scophthalmus maximus TaxID=52904 RepID=A0A6A4TS53_SCOMX|nr:hypothetical protein F2P81_002070 [Scophthalmus maximus]